MSTSTEDLQRTAWRELYEMLSADIELDADAQNAVVILEIAPANEGLSV